MQPLRRCALAAALLLLTAAARADHAGEVYAPGVVSTAAAEVRIAFSPDGRRMLWGSIGRDGPKDQEDIWERHRQGAGWSAPARVSFDTEAVEFDPAFSPDGGHVYFHSDQPGGLGGTDIYVVDLDPATGRFGTPRNLGPTVNSKGDEWAPTPTAHGTLVFSSDGWGGQGKHDLFEARLTDPAPAPRNLGLNINSADEDFDETLAADGKTLIFSSGVMTDDDAKVSLYASRLTPAGWGPRRPLAIGCSTFVIGSALSRQDPGHLYFAANCPGGQGRMDIRRAPWFPPRR